ncbi:MAG: serine O-acetyltransferase [Candidatus Methylomirabilales bacterium]
MFETIRRDIQAARDRDPAVRSTLEILFCYPGLHALWFHRLAHGFWNRGFLFIGRFISHVNRFLTGIEIHPAARIGPGFFIDHGMGVVIGETTEVGENVTIYQGVTLGGTSLERKKRHPTIGNNVIIGSGAKILGPFTVGDNSKIGSGTVVVKEVPSKSVVVGVPGRVIYQDGKKVSELDFDWTNLPDPVAQALQCLLDRMHEMEKEIAELKGQVPKETPFDFSPSLGRED